MKNIVSCWIILLMVANNLVEAQVKDIGIDFKKKGYIKSVDLIKNEMLVDFVTTKEISTEILKIPKECSILLSNGKAAIGDFHPGMAIMVEGEYFRVDMYSIAKKISEYRDYSSKVKIKNGRIDAITSESAIIDGRRVKLKKGTIIKGANGYDKTFYSVNELLLGDIVNLEGVYNSDGYIYASSFRVEPDTETDDDKKVKEESLKELHDIIYPLWFNKANRKKLLGKTLSKGYVITNNETLQEYVNTIGLKLIPQHIKSKINFVFIVIDNRSFNACVYPNGLSFVNLGLLKQMKNDAQLAAVLGHEIAHAIYEHAAKRSKDIEGVEKKLEITSQIKNVFGKIITSVQIPMVSNGHIRIDDKTKDLITSTLPISFLEKKIANYSIEEESQADRVGLYLLQAAGYDPREAPVIWRNQFNQDSNHVATNHSFIDNSISAINTTNLSVEGIAIELLNTVATNNSIKGKETHPKNLKRFEDLNEMIDLFWSANSIITHSTTGVDNWNKTWKKVAGKIK